MSQKTRATCASSWCHGQQLEGLGVGAGQDVGLLDAAEPVDGRAVEGHPLVERVLQLGRGDVEPLGGPEHVGEPQLDEADAPLLHGPEHVVPLALHRTSFACRAHPTHRGPGPARPHRDCPGTAGNLGRCRTCAWPPRSSTPSSATLRATSSGCSPCWPPPRRRSGHLRRARAGDPGLPARGPAPQAGVRRRQRDRAREGRGGDPGSVPSWSGSWAPPPEAADWPTRRRCAPVGVWPGVYRKHFLPNYGVFDEQRWFLPSTSRRRSSAWPGPGSGFSICEDVWFDDGPVAHAGRAGADVVVNLNASPYNRGRRTERLAMLSRRVAEAGCAIAYVNQVGGQDELVFDGDSLVVGARRHAGRPPARSSPKTSSSSTSRSAPTGPMRSPSCCRGSW